MQEIIPIILLFCGESLAIYSEIIAARNIDSFASTFWKMAIVIAISGLFLIAGYMFGQKYLHDIWIIGTVSIASIIIVEPINRIFSFSHPSGARVIDRISSRSSWLMCSLIHKVNPVS